MNILPKNRSWHWAWLCLGQAVLLYAAILLSRAILHVSVTPYAYFSLAVLALFLSLLCCVGGWLGGRLYFICSATGALVGMAYLLFTAFSDLSPGWGDLTGMIGLMFFSAIGIGMGLTVELVRHLVMRARNRC